MKRFIVVLFVIVVTYCSSLAQQAELVDEFGTPTCEDIWARLDNLLLQLRNNPGSTATISFAGRSGELHKDLYYESMIRNYAINRKVSPKNWQIVRLAPSHDRLIAFYLTPPNGMPPALAPREWGLVYSPKAKPFIFFQDAEVDSGLCLKANEMSLFADVLKANPQADANIVLYAFSDREFRRRGRAVVKMLRTNYGIKKSQVHLYRKPSSQRHGCSDCDEYWFVP